MQIRRYRGLAVLVVLLGATVALAACAPLGGSTPTAPPPTATVPANPTATPTVSATLVPTATTLATPTSAPVPTVTATIALTNTATPLAPTVTLPPPTATVPATAPPTPTATVPPATATAVPATLVPRTPPIQTGASATDVQGRCAITLPAGFADTGDGSFSGANGRAVITLTPLVIGTSDTLDDVALPFVSTFTAAIGNYQQTAVARGEDSLRLDFTGRTTAPGRGTIFLHQFDGTVCALSFFVVQGGEVPYDQTVDALLTSLRPAGAVGQAGRWGASRRSPAIAPLVSDGARWQRHRRSHDCRVSPRLMKKSLFLQHRVKCAILNAKGGAQPS